MYVLTITSTSVFQSNFVKYKSVYVLKKLLDTASSFLLKLSCSPNIRYALKVKLQLTAILIFHIILLMMD